MVAQDKKQEEQIEDIKGRQTSFLSIFLSPTFHCRSSPRAGLTVRDYRTPENNKYALRMHSSLVRITKLS